MIKTLPSACSIRLKKILKIALKVKSPEWSTQNDIQTDRHTDRLTLNFINVDNTKHLIIHNAHIIALLKKVSPATALGNPDVG